MTPRPQLPPRATCKDPRKKPPNMEKCVDEIQVRTSSLWRVAQPGRDSSVATGYRTPWRLRVRLFRSCSSTKLAMRAMERESHFRVLPFGSWPRYDVDAFSK